MSPFPHFGIIKEAMVDTHMFELLRALNRARDHREVAEIAVEYALSQVPEAREGFLLFRDDLSGCFEVLGEKKRTPRPTSLLAERAQELLGTEPRLIRRLDPDLNKYLGPFEVLLVAPAAMEEKVYAYLVIGHPSDPAAIPPEALERLGPGWEEITRALARLRRCELLEAFGPLLMEHPDAVLVVDGNGLIRAWNRGAEELFGYAPHEILGRPFALLVPGEFQGEVKKAIAECIAKGTSPKRLFETQGQRKDGTVFSIQWAAGRGEVGGRSVCIVVGRDLGEKLELQRRLQESERRFKTLFERLPDAVYITAFDGTILAANPQAAAQTGYPLEELVGMNIMWDIAAEEPAITYESVNERLRRGETVFFEEKKRRKDGTVYWTECAVTQIEYRGQAATLSVNRDITTRKRLEEELQQRIRELETLNHALRSVGSSLELEEVLQRLAHLSGELVGAEYAVIAVFDERGHLRKVVDRPMGLGPLPPRMRTRGLTRMILTTGEPVLVSEVNPDGSTVPPIRTPDGAEIAVNPVVVEAGIRSLAGIPIKYKGHVRGILSVFSRRPHAFDKRLPALSALADAAAVAVENASLYEETRYLFEESPVSLWVEDFSAIVERLKSLRDQGVEDLRAYIRDHPGFVVECVKLIRVVEVNRATLRLYKVRDLRELSEKLAQIIPPEVEPLLEKELLAIWEGKREFEGIGINRTAEGEPIHIYIRWRVFPGHEEDYSQVLVSVLDITDRVRAEEELKSHVEKLAALHRAVWDLQRCRTVEEVCKVAVEGAQGILGFAVCNIGLVQGDMVVPVYGVGEIQPRPFKRGEGLVWRSLREGRSFWGNLQDLPGAKPVDPRLKSAISVPIGNLGVFQAASFEPDAFTEDDVRLAEILAGHVSEEIRRVRLEEELRQRAIRDALTGLYNRGHLMEVLGEKVRKARKEGRSFAVLVGDLDNFKLVNDRFGHPFGDEVLKEVARILRETATDSDLVFRYGGDEFVLLLSGTEAEARELASRVREAVGAWAEENGLHALGFGISLGIAIWRPEKPLPPEELLRRADRSLYRLKRRA